MEENAPNTDSLELITDNPLIKKVYVSGPITGEPDGNKEEFAAGTTKMRDLGFEVVSPSELDATKNLIAAKLAAVMPGGDEWAKLVAGDIAHVMAVDAIVMLPGWTRSQGAKSEAWLAVTLNKPVYYIETLERIPEDELPRPEKAGSLLDEAARQTGDNVLEKHGHPYDAFTRDSIIVSALLGKEITPAEIPLFMMGMKLSSYAHNPGRGRRALTAMAGYAQTVELLAEKLGGWSKLTTLPKEVEAVEEAGEDIAPQTKVV